MASSKLYNVQWDDAACKGKPLDLFFSHNKRDQKKAKGLCASCPIQPACLQWALEHSELGVWGGLTSSERSQEQKP